MSPDDERHGTYAGAATHKREKTKLCEPCRKARADYMREYRKKNKRHLERGQATTRALWRLADRYRAEYEALYVEERTRAQIAKMQRKSA